MSRTNPGPIDLVHLARQSGGDSTLEHELLALFADQCIRHLATIRSAQSRSGMEAAHTLKGAARAIGAWGVADAAEKVEHALSSAGAAQMAAPNPAPLAGLDELSRATDAARAAIALMARAA
ncbi:MAG: Hpt domain-containing protein [Bosea sp.]|jgi:HPt (histidine-containing phosphotransfer) domain-containing protein|nr:Hpt domain-containing protein [Bosea sp. (in: a-proteobacteria)]